MQDGSSSSHASGAWNLSNRPIVRYKQWPDCMAGAEGGSPMKLARQCTRAAPRSIEIAGCFREQSSTFIPNLGHADDSDLRIEMLVSGERP